MKRINYESDFKIIEGFKDGSSMLNAPFRFTYYTKMTRGTYVAEYDGTTFTNCSPTEDGRVVVAFDSPQLGMGVLTVKREFFLTDSDFSDGVCNLVSVESTNITLDKGVTDDLGTIEVLVQPYYHVVGEGGGGEIPNGTITEAKLANQSVSTSKVKDGAITEAKLSEEVKEKLNKAGGSGEKGEDGKSAYEIWLEQGNEGSEQDFLDSLKGADGEKGDKGDKMTYDDLTEEEKDDLASRVEVPAPEIPEGSITEDKLSEDVRTKLNQGDGGGMSEIPDGGVTTDKIADGAVTENKLGNDVSTILGVMRNKLDILYKVTLTFSGGGNKKKGTSINVTLSWAVKVNGTSVNPSSQTLNGEALDVTLRKKTFTGVTTDTTYTLVVDGVTATQSVRFFNPSYFGVVSPDYQVSSDVSGLTEQTNYGSRPLTKTASASGSMKVVYLYPSALGSLTSIKDGNNFDITGSFTRITDISINGEKYMAYLLTQEANIDGLTFKFT